MASTILSTSPTTPMQTVVTGECRNCHGTIPVDVTVDIPAERPPVAPVRWELADHFTHVECRHCGTHLSAVDLETEGFDENVQDAVRVMLRATPGGR